MKKTLSDLAALGGRPAFAEPLHVGRPNIGNARLVSEKIAEILESRFLSNHGPFLRRFERHLEDRLGAPHCVAVANGTLGLILAAKALGLEGEVILPSFTFVASAHALRWLNITPVFCEIDPATYQLDPAAVEALITPRTRGILAVHLFGRSCDMNALEALARRRGLKLLVDAAHAVGCTVRGTPVATRGDAVVFSFHATKVMNTFEGGAVATKDPAVAESVRLLSNFGFSDEDRVTALGINAKMSEPAAAMGLVSLESLDDFIAANHRNYEAYRKALDSLPGLTFRALDDQSASNRHYVVVEVDGAETGISRDVLLRVLRAENVLARRYFYPGCHRMEPYASSPPWRGLRLPHTEAVAERILVLPTGTAVQARDIEMVGDIVRLALKAGPELGRRMAVLNPIGTAP